MTSAPTAHSHTRRILVEQLGQMLVVASSFLDRLLLTALLLRHWEISTFEAWSACIALSAMVSLFELGFNLYFNNQLMIEMERGDREAVRTTYAVGNSLFALSAAFGLFLLVGVIFVAHPLGNAADGSVVLAAIVLSAANSAKIALCSVYALYRANREYARFAALQGMSEIVRIGSVIVVVLLRGNLVEAAIASAIATTLVSVVFVIVDTRRRYFPHAYLFRAPERSAVRGILGTSSLYMAQAVPQVLFTSLPVILLRKMELAPGLVAAFVLVRTLSNVARAPLQSVGIVFGQESGRRIATQDLGGARRVMESAGRLFAVASGLVSGLLLAGGEPLTLLWTGNPDLFDGSLIVAAAMPMILTPTAVLIHNVLSSHQAPLRPAIARWVQLAATALAYMTFPNLEPPIRMMTALSAGEILGYAPLAYWAVARLIPGLTWTFHLSQLSLVLGSAALGAVVTRAVLGLLAPHGGMAFLLSFGLVGSIFALALFFLGVDSNGRRHLLDQMTSLFRRREAPQTTTHGQAE